MENISDEVIVIARHLKILELCGELRIVYVPNLGAKALVMSNCDKFCIAIDPALSYHQQIKELWHEAKHIFSHINTKSSVYIAETEADEFSTKAMRYDFDELRTAL